jgi:hypothetical protein
MASKEPAMNHRALACTLALFALAAACGGEQPAATQPSNPAASASAAPAASEAPAASAAPSAAASAAPAPSAAPSASVAEAPAGPPPPGPGEWDKWSKDQKLAYMKTAVLPKMGGLFHDVNPTRYAEPKCVLCHSAASAKSGSFKMPNADLPKLPATPEGFKKLHDAKPQVMDFMMQQVVPQMAALVGEQPFDVKTGKGFGCFECHTKKK